MGKTLLCLHRMADAAATIPQTRPTVAITTGISAISSLVVTSTSSALGIVLVLIAILRQKPQMKAANTLTKLMRARFAAVSCFMLCLYSCVRSFAERDNKLRSIRVRPSYVLSGLIARNTRIDRALNLVVGCDLAQRHHSHFNRRLPPFCDSATLIPARPVRRYHYFRPTGPRHFPLRNQRTSAGLAGALGLTILLTILLAHGRILQRAKLSGVFSQWNVGGTACATTDGRRPTAD